VETLWSERSFASNFISLISFRDFRAGYIAPAVVSIDPVAPASAAAQKIRQ
jgi:hypothetical protein